MTNEGVKTQVETSLLLRQNVIAQAIFAFISIDAFSNAFSTCSNVHDRDPYATCMSLFHDKLSRPVYVKLVLLLCYTNCRAVAVSHFSICSCTDRGDKRLGI